MTMYQEASTNLSGKGFLIQISTPPSPLMYFTRSTREYSSITNWCRRIMDEGKLDERIRCLPSAYGVRHFKDGVTALSQLSGMERKHMAKILLGCLIGV